MTRLPLLVAALTLAFPAHWSAAAAAGPDRPGGPAAQPFIVDLATTNPKDLGGGSVSTPTAINNQGTVVGYGAPSNGSRVFAWKSKAGAPAEKLPSLDSPAIQAFGLNGNGVAVGQARYSGSKRRAFRGKKLLPSLAKDDFVEDINDSRLVVGISGDGHGSGQAAVWGVSGPPTLLPPATFGRAHAINNSGEIVGELGFHVSPVFWPDHATHVALPTLGGAQGSAVDINENGVIAGWVTTPGGTAHAVIWRAGQLIDLDPVRGGMAIAINNHDMVLGTGGLSGLWVWDPLNGQQDVTCLLPPGVSIGAVDINDAAQIVGEGTINDRSRRALLLNLASAPAGAGCPAPQLPATVAGTVEFEKVKVDASGLRVDLFSDTRPASGVRVELVDDATSAVLASATTDSRGRYSLPSAGAPSVHVRALADSAEGQVVDMSGSVVYSVAGGSFGLAPGSLRTEDLLAPDAEQASGPFNILDALRRAMEFARQAEGTVAVPKVTVRWAVGNQNGTRFDPDSSQAFILGDRTTDSDEYDDMVLNHEYAHYLEVLLSRRDSPGGTHETNDVLDPRLAWHEAWAEFFGVASQGGTPASPLYFDSKSPAPGGVFSFNLEQNNLPASTPGYWDEHSVASAVWDLFDAAPDTGDAVTAPWPLLWQAFRDVRDARFLYAIDWADALVANDAAVGPELQAILAERQVVFTPGGSPSVPNPFPAPIAPGVPVPGSLDSLTLGRENLLSSSDFYEFTLAEPRSVTIDLQVTGGAPGTNDLDLLLLDDQGVVQASSTNSGAAAESIQRTLDPGTYVIQVKSFSTQSGTVIFNKGTYNLTANY